MSKIIRCGQGEISERHLFSLHLSAADELTNPIDLGSRYFVCFLGWDSSNSPTSCVSRLAEILLRSGCVYLCSWGNGCGRVHDIIDEVCVGSNPPPEVYPDVMTTSHENESLDDALWFFLNTAWPDDAYTDDCLAALAISIGLRPEFRERIDFALVNPRDFSSQVLQQNEGGS